MAGKGKTGLGNFVNGRLCDDEAMGMELDKTGRYLHLNNTHFRLDEMDLDFKPM